MNEETPELPFIDYSNYEFAFNETPDFISDIRSKLSVGRKYVFEGLDAFSNQLAAPLISDTPSATALHFLENIALETVLELLGDQKLEVWEDEKKAGSYSISINKVPSNENLFRVITEYCAQEDDHRIHIIHDGLINAKMETIFQKRTEIESALRIYREYRSHVEQEGANSYVVNVLNDDSGVIRTWSNVYPRKLLRGFISECAHVLLGRLFSCEENVPTDFVVVGLDRFGRFGKIAYTCLKPKVLTLRPYRIACFGFSRESHFTQPEPVLQHFFVEEYYLNRRLVHKHDLKSLVTAKSASIPEWELSRHLQPFATQAKPSLSIEDDWIMKVRNCEQKDLFRAKYCNIVARYPQLTQPLKEVVHLVLTYRPEDVFAFVSECFRHWNGVFKTNDTKTVNTTVPRINALEEKLKAENTLHQLLRAYEV